MFRKLALIVLLCCLLAVPVLAQDATPEATASAPTSVTVNVEPSAPAPTAEPLGGNNGLFIIIGGAVLFVLGIGSAVLYKKTGADAAATLEIEKVRQNAQMLAEIRYAYEGANQHVKEILQSAKTVAGAIAPLTPIKADDELALLLRDITDPTVRAAISVQAKTVIAQADSVSRASNSG